MAHSGHDGSTTTTSSNIVGMMIPYFHFTLGDPIFIASWRPTSAGALAGACIGLVVLCLFERWLAAVRSVFNKQWHHRAFDLTANRDSFVTSQRIASSSKINSTEVIEPVENGVQEINKQQSTPPVSTVLQVRTVKSRSRTIPPFIAAHDVPRGILYAAQMLVLYLLMLAIMTFQAAYFISIILGLGIGETIFGRVGTMNGGH